MATRTIANGGGNFNATGTWVEGAVPVAGDAVVATSTSGQLTVNVASGGVGLLSVDFTGYLNTLTMNNTLTVSGPVTFAAGMTIAGTSDLIINNTSTITPNGKTFTGGLQIVANAKVITLASDFQINGTFTISSGNNTINGAFNLFIGGNMTTTTVASGTATLVMNGTGTWSGTGRTISKIILNGTVTITGTVGIGNAGQVKYSGGTVATPVIQCYGLNNTLDTAGMNWTTVTIDQGFSGVLTLPSTLSATTLNINGNVTFQGTGGFNVGTYNQTFANQGIAVSLLAGTTYTVRTAMNMQGIPSKLNTMVSSVVNGTKAIFNLVSGATQSNYGGNVTDIDSSGGQKIYTYGSVLTRTINWVNFTIPTTIGYVSYF